MYACLPDVATKQPHLQTRLSGFLATPQGPQRITVLLDTGATHCFICTQLAVALGLLTSDQPGTTSVTMAAIGGTLELTVPVLIHLGLGDTFRESMSVSLMDMDVGDNRILGSDWISSHDLPHLFVDGQVSSGLCWCSFNWTYSRPRYAQPPLSTLAVIGHGEFRRLRILRHITRETQPDMAAIIGTVAHGWLRRCDCCHHPPTLPHSLPPSPSPSLSPPSLCRYSTVIQVSCPGSPSADHRFAATTMAGNKLPPNPRGHHVPALPLSLPLSPLPPPLSLFICC